MEEKHPCFLFNPFLPPAQVKSVVRKLWLGTS